MFEAYLAEFVGTAVLLLLGSGVVAGVLLRESKSEGAGWIVITFGWGVAVAVAVYIAAASGAHLNPAVTLGLAASDNFQTPDVGPFNGWAEVPGYIVAQFLGAFVGSSLAFLAYRDHFAATADPDLKLAVFSTAPAIRNPGLNAVTEAIGTFVLVFGVLGIGNNTPVAGLAPLLVGFLVLGIGLSLGGPTGYAINPARDLGPRIAHAVLPIPGKGGSDWGYAWVPVVGPVVGGVLAGLAWNATGFAS